MFNDYQFPGYQWHGYQWWDVAEAAADGPPLGSLGLLGVGR